MERIEREVGEAAHEGEVEGIAQEENSPSGVGGELLGAIEGQEREGESYGLEEGAASGTDPYTGPYTGPCMASRRELK